MSIKHITTALLFLLAVAIPAMAQPKFVKKVQKGIISVNTYDKLGNLLQQGTGFYVGANGEAIASYAVFKGAAKATVIDAQGKQADVDCILGADDSYSLVRFKVNVKGNTVLSRVPSAQPKGTTMYAIAYTNSGAPLTDVSAVADTSFINGKYAYYTLAKQLDDNLVGCPVFNADGVLVGILHSQMANKSNVLDIRFCETLKMEAIPNRSASVALNNIFIPKALPETAEEALVYAYFHSRSASNDEYMDIMNRFVAAFPQNAEGYNRRATPLIDLLRFDEAEADLQKHLALVEDKAAGNYNVATTIYNKLSLQPEPAYEKWNHDVALSYVDKALELLPKHAANEAEKHSREVQYNTLKAQILTSKKDYNAAIAVYESLCQGEDKTPSYLYAISLAKEARGDSAASIVADLDSAIAMFGTPMPAEAANYVMRRGQLHANAGHYREAVVDYNQYCYLLNNRVNDVFFYERSQIEVNARMFQQALDDITKAASMAPRNAMYQLEKASISLRVGLLDDCITACQATIALNPNIIDSYRILGYAQLQKGDKASAQKNLQHAVDLGDENAQKLLDTYFK